MKTKHTPGEWKYRVTKDAVTIESRPVIYDSVTIAKLTTPITPLRDFYHSTGSLDPDTPLCKKRISQQLEANAKLIAAAPDLLEALIQAQKFMLKTGITYDNSLIYNTIDKAIKKATE